MPTNTDPPLVNVIFPIMTPVVSTTYSIENIVLYQPMTLPTSNIFFLDLDYTDRNKIYEKRRKQRVGTQLRFDFSGKK